MIEIDSHAVLDETKPLSRFPKTFVFVWENFGPMHDDRCRAVALANPAAKVIGLQWTRKSEVYDWHPQPSLDFQKMTLFNDNDPDARHSFKCAMRLVRACWQTKATHVFLCHYERPATALAAIIVRLLGKRLFLLYDSKFDDYPRFVWREVFKSLWLWPYRGALTASRRSKDYLRFLGVSSEHIQLGYNAISLERIRRLAGSRFEPFSSRHFTINARLVEKKNLATVLKAYALYAHAVKNPRPLRIFGSGLLEGALRKDVRDQNIEHLVTFEGFQQTDVICRALGTTLALLLISREEQFGIAIIEALAVGVPVIISPACGAYDEFVRNGVNGFVVEPDNLEGMAFFMKQLAGDEILWQRMADAASHSAEGSDVAKFVHAVAALTGS